MRPAAHPSGRRPRRRNRRRPLPEHIVREFKDLGLGWLFENPRQIGPLFTLEAPELAARLDLDRAEPLTRSFRPHDLHKRETDLLYRVPYRIGDPAAGRFLWIIVLLENQEQPRVSLVVRVLIYMAHVWAREHRRWEREQVQEGQRRLPIIVPMVFYTGAQRWAGPLQLAPGWCPTARPHRGKPTVLLQWKVAMPLGSVGRQVSASGAQLRVGGRATAAGVDPMGPAARAARGTREVEL